VYLQVGALTPVWKSGGAIADHTRKSTVNLRMKVDRYVDMLGWLLLIVACASMLFMLAKVVGAGQ